MDSSKKQAVDAKAKSVPAARAAPQAAEQVKIIRKNAKGGVLITPEEVQAAFEFLDADREGKISMSQLKKRLQVFFPNMTTKEYRFLMNNKREISVNDIIELLHDNDITGFDPVTEAFRAYDTEGEGFIPQDRLRGIFASLGLGELSSTEIELLMKVADVDGDGAISLDDFRNMLEMHKGNFKGTGHANQASGPASPSK